MKKSVGKIFVLSSLAVLSLCACNSGNKKTCKIYSYNSSYNAVDTGASIDLYFYDVANLPYVCVNDYFNIFIPSTFSISSSNNVFTFTNNIWKNRTYTSDNKTYKSYNATATFNANTNTMTYGDYACFTNLDSYALNPVDVVCGEGICFEVGKKSYPLFQSKDGENIYFPGDEKSIDLDDYGIVSKVIDNKLYLPLYTVKTLFTTYISSFFYNGKALYIDLPNSGSSYNSTVANGMFTPSTAYLEYAYNQEALDLDIRFGLKGFTRNNRSDDKTTTYKSSGYQILGSKSNYTSSAAKFDEQLMSVYASALDDGGHTGCTGYSYYSSKTPANGTEFSYLYKSYSNIEIDRKNYTTKKIEGETYKIPFSKSVVYTDDNYTKATLCLDGFDTNGFEQIIKFIRFINSYTNVTNAIIDLSCNGGGYVYMQYLLTYYLTGGKATNYVKNNFNGSCGYVNYDADSNMNKTIGDDGDVLPSRLTSIDILTSNYTFSAANATACYLQANNDSRFHFYGETSGGGTCCVDSTMMNPLGMSSQWSSPIMLTYDDYGKTYSIDNGVTTDASKTWDSHNETSCKEFYGYYKDSTNVEVK